MIKLEIEDYCKECPDFNEDVQKPDKYYADGEVFIVGDTVIRCEHRERCERLKKRLES